MLTHDPIQAECLSLVASLYGAIADADRFQARRMKCEAWLADQGFDQTPAVAFLRGQIVRAAEARTLAGATRSELPTVFAVLAVDGQGRLLAAGPEAWPLLGSGAPGDGPLRMPMALRAFAEDAAQGLPVPRALRVPLDDGSTELAGIVLGVDDVRHAVGTLRVMTMLLCDVGRSIREAELPGPGRGEVRECCA